MGSFFWDTLYALTSLNANCTILSVSHPKHRIVSDSNDILSLHSRTNETFLILQDDPKGGPVEDYMLSVDTEENKLVEIDLATGKTARKFDLGK